MAVARSRVPKIGTRPGGWITRTGGPGPDVYVRFRDAEDGGIEAVEVHILSDRAIDSADLRQLSLARLAGEYRFARGDVWKGVAPRPIGGPGLDFQAVLAGEPVEPGPAPRRSARNARLDIPDSVRKPDSFYEAVARAYTALVPTSRRPAHEIAEANDVPITSVHGWIKEARRRAFLPPGRKGSRG